MPAILLRLGLALATCLASCAHSNCIAMGKGCGEFPRITLQTCAAGVEALSLEQLVAQPPADGSEIRVRGPLRREGGTCTAMDCGEGRCCNSCGAGFHLGAGDGFGRAQGPSVHLSGSLDGVGLFCRGDDSILCCPIDVDGGQVIATGTLKQLGASTRGPVFQLIVEDICWSR